LNGEEHKGLKQYVKALNQLYHAETSLYELDYEYSGFEWINDISARENIIVFSRKTKHKENTLVIVCNFVPVLQENYKIGVPYEGKYKEIFSSDKNEFGGLEHLNKRVKQSKKDECDGRENSICITVPPLGLTILKYMGEKTGTKSKKNLNETKAKNVDNKKVNLKDKLAADVMLADELIDQEKSIIAAKQIEEARLSLKEEPKKRKRK